MTGKPRLLFVDDEQEILDFLALVFRGCECATALSAEAALELLRRERFDVLVTDIKMPGGTGLGLIDDAKGICPDLPIIVITGHYQEMPDGAQEKVRDWILKPFGIETIRGAVMKAVDSRR